MAENPRTIMITGANGFVGSRLCRAFVDAGFTVIAAVRKTSDLSLLDGVPVQLRYGDVTQPETLPDLLADVTHVVHNAGVVKARKRETFFDVNEQGTRLLMEAVVTHAPDIERVVLVSSMAASGPSQVDRPRAESDPPEPVTTYGESKLAGERAALAFADRLPLTIVRPSGVYGPGDKEMLALFKTVGNRIKPMIGNMSRRLQVVHVDDLCAAIVRAATTEVPSGSAYFVAERTAYDMREFIGTFTRVWGRVTLPLVIPGWLFRVIAVVSTFFSRLVGATPMLTREKTNELLASWEVDISRARDDLGFESAIPLERGVSETLKWYRERGWL